MEEDVITQVEIVGSELQLLREKAAIDIQVSTARAFPRNMKLALDNAIFTATMDIETASSCIYSVPRAGKAITGPSVHLARIIVQNWGNFRAETKVIEEGAKYVTSEAVAWDLETNVAIKVTVKRPITTSSGKRMSDDMVGVTGNAANAIALRNAVFNVVPKAVTNKVYEASQKMIVGDDANFNKRVSDVLAGYKKVYGKEAEEVLTLVGKKSIEQLTKADLVVLIGVAQALKDGEATADLVFKVKKSGDEKKADLKQNQQKSANPVSAMP